MAAPSVSQSLASIALEQSLPEYCSVVVFPIAGYWFALPIAAVLRTLPSPQAAAIVSQYSESFDFNIEQALLAELQPAGMTYIDDRPVPLLDLHPCLSFLEIGVEQQSPSKDSVSPTRLRQENESTTRPDALVQSNIAKLQQFLLLTTVNGQSYAILVDDTPTLMELPLSSIRILPASYRQAIQGIASHVAIEPAANSEAVILLLDLNQAVQVTQKIHEEN